MIGPVNAAGIGRVLMVGVGRGFFGAVVFGRRGYRRFYAFIA